MIEVYHIFFRGSAPNHLRSYIVLIVYPTRNTDFDSERGRNPMNNTMAYCRNKAEENAKYVYIYIMYVSYMYEISAILGEGVPKISETCLPKSAGVS